MKKRIIQDGLEPHEILETEASDHAVDAARDWFEAYKMSENQVNKMLEASRKILTTQDMAKLSGEIGMAVNPDHNHVLSHHSCSDPEIRSYIHEMQVRVAALELTVKGLVQGFTSLEAIFKDYYKAKSNLLEKGGDKNDKK